MQSNNLVDVNSLIDESPHQSQSVDVNSLIEQPQKKNSSQTSSNISAPSTSPSNGQLGLLNGQRPQEYSLNKSGFKPVINMEVPKEPETQAATEKVGLTPIQDLQKQNTSRPDNTIAIPNIGVFNKQVNAFGEVTDKTITDNAPDESVVLRNEYNQKRKGILNPQVVVPQSELTPENNFGLASPSNQAISDATVVSKPIKKIAGAPQNEPAPPTPEQQFKQKVDENLTQLDKETIAKTGEYAMKVTSDPVAAGFITKAVLGDNIAISQKRQIDKGYNVPQADLYNTGQVGISSFMAALDKKYADDPQNAEYLKQKADLQNQAATLIDKFPEYKTSQLTKAVAIELGKLHPETANNAAMAKLYLPELKKEMGLSDADIKNIDFDNYPTSNFITSAIAPIYKGALGLGAFGTRIIGDVVGDDKDFLNSKITQMQQSPTFFDDIQTMQNTGVTVDANKTSPTFLQDVADPNKGKYNYNFHTISNAIGNGVGQLAWFVYGSKGIGTAAEKIAGDIAAKSGGVAIDGLPFKLSPDATNEVGMAGLMIGQGYEDNYQKARNIISDKPEDEWKRHAFALLQGSLDYLGFRVLGNVVKGLPPTAEKEIGEVFKDAPNLAAVNKTALQSKLTQILKGAGEAAKETAFVGSATTLSEIAKAAVVNVLGNDKAAEEENKQLPDVIASSLMGLPFNMFLPIVGAKIIAGGQSKIQNENIYNAGISPENYKGDAHKLFEMGAINQEQLNDRIQVINTAANVVKSIPSDVFDNLNHNQRVSYVNSKIKEAALKAKAANIQDDALSEFYNSQIKNEVAKRADILNGGGKEGEYPQSVAVLKPKTKEEINNQIPDVTIAPTENIPEKQPTDAKVILPQTIAKEQGRQIITTSDKNNETQNAEVPKPSKEASTPNEGANKVEQPTEENLVNQAKDLVNNGVVKGFTAETLKESANNNPAEFQQHLKDISEQANDPKSNKATVDTYGKELVDIAQKLNPVESKQANVKSEVNLAVEPSKPISEMNSEEMYDYATKVKKELAKQDKEFAGKTEAEKDAGGYYDVIDNVGELRDASTKINFIENSEGLNDLSSSVRSALGNIKDKPSEYDLAILNAAKKKAVELNIPTEDLIKEVIKKEGNRYNDANDAEFMMRNALEKINQPNEAATATTPTEVNKPISVNEGEQKSILGSNVDLKGNKKKVWMQKAETADEAKERLVKSVDVNIANNPDLGFATKTYIDKEGKSTEVELHKNDDKYEWFYEKSKKPFASFDNTKDAVDYIMKQPFWDNGELNKNGRDDAYFAKSKAEHLQREIDNGNVRQDVSEGKISVTDAKNIIENAGLEVPKDILEKVNSENKAPKEKPISVNNEIKNENTTGTDKNINAAANIKNGSENKPITEGNKKSKPVSEEAKPTISDKFKNKYKDKVKGLFDTGENKDADKGEIKTDNGKQSIDQYVSRAKEVASKLFPDAKFETYDNHADFEKAGGIEGSRGTAMTDENGNKTILLNLAQMKEDGVGKTAFHEVIHPIVSEVFGRTPEELVPVWNEIATTMRDVEGMDKVWEHLVWYNEHKTPVEGITEFLTQIADGNIKVDDIPKAKQSKLFDLINKLFEKLGIKFKIDSGLDLHNFATEIKKAFDTGNVEGLRRYTDKESEPQKEELRKSVKHLLAKPDSNAASLFGAEKERQAILDAFEYTTRGTIKKTHSVDVKAYDSKNGTRYLAMDKEGDVLSGAFVDKNNKITGIVTDSGYENVGIGTKLYKEVLKLNPDAEPDGTISKQGQRLIDRANADTSSDKEALVRNMVQDAMDEGLTSLNEVSDAITSGLENNSSELKKLIEDAFNKINEPIVTSESGGNDNIPPKERGVDNSGDTFSEWSRVNLESLNKIKDQFRKIGIGWDERAESAMRNLQKRSKKGERLYDTALREMDNFYKSLSKDKTPRFNTDDQVAMHFLKIATEQSMANLAEDAMSKNAFSNVESIGADILSDQFNRVSAVLGAMRSESGVGLAYGNVEARLSPDYGLKVRQMQMIRANKGEPLSDEQNNFVKDHWEKEKELNKREQEVREQALKDEYEKRISDLQSNFEKQIKALKEKKAPEPNTKNQKTKLSSSLRDISKRIRETNEFDKFIKGEKGDTKAAGITFDMKEGLAQAIDYIAKAVEGTEKLSDAIKKAVDKYKGDLDENGVKDFKEKIHTLITKASLPDREYVFSKIKELAHKDNASSITKEMVGKNLIKNFIDSHIGDFDKKDILNEATKRLQEVLPDVTKEQVTEAYLKKGDYVLPKKNRLDEDVSKEKLALKKIAKDELTANQQQKIKLQEEKQKALKRIEELKGMQERGEYVTEEPSKPVVLTKQDAELINIDRERNKLESAYRKEAAKIKENQNHVVQRVADTVRSLWVAVLIGRPKTFAKIAWFMVARPTSEVLSKLSFGKAFGLVAPDLASAAKAGGESNSIRSVGKMTAAFFKNMGEDKLQRLYENGEKRYILAKAAYEQYKNTEGHSDKKLAVLKRDMDNKMFDSLGNVMYQFIGGSSIKDAIETLVHRTNIIEKQFGKIRDENIKEGNTLDKVNYVMGFIGRSHSALKTLSGRASFAGAFMARIEAAYERGQDLGADKLLEIAHESYLDWERGKYQQSNWISDTWNRIVSSIDEGKVNKEKWKNYNKSAQLLARTEVAITRVPVNIIHEEVAEYLAGAFRAPILAAKAYNKAKAQAIEEGYTKKISVNDEIESGTAKEQFKKRVGEIVRDMDGEQAAKVMRLFRKGGMGLGLYAAALIWGGIHFGIFPHKGQKKVKKDEDLAPDELNPGQIMFGNDKLGEVTSAMISHTPALWDTFMGLGLAKSYYDDVNNGRTTTDAAARALTLHLKIIESNIPQAQIISPTETVQKVGAGFKKNVLDSWGLTDAKETKGGLPKNSTAYTYLDKHNIDVAVPEKFEVKVGKDKKHPFGRMTDEDYSKFKKIRSSLLKERLSEFLPNAQEAGLPRDKVQEEIKSISSSVTKIAKNQMISDGIISPINNNE